MFFARTQKEHDWASPAYRFTQAQQRAWDRLIEEARQVTGEEMELESEDDEEQEDSEGEVDDVESEAEIDGSHGTDRAKPKRLTGIQKACLDFCMELLNQTVTRGEYDSALVYVTTLRRWER